MAEEKNDAAARPFQLRPSILSGSGFGSSFSSAGGKAVQGFILRPSSLASAADKLESLNKTDTRKRTHSSEDDTEDEEDTDVTKKSKVVEEKPTSGETKSKIIEKPTGIGTFGSSNNNTKETFVTNGNNEKTSDKKAINYFQQGLNNSSQKLSFVFGINASCSPVGGFNSLKKETEDSKNDAPSNVNGKEKLLENADEYQKSHDKKMHLAEVEQFTGEEGEKHVLQILCKLHFFEKSKKNWIEKGRGTLKLNDICQAEGVFQSRLVFRTQGTNIVLLNTMLWPDMCCEKVKEKSVRLTAVNAETKEVQVCLVTTNKKDSLQVFTAIDRRIEALKRNRNCLRIQNGDDMPSSNDSKIRTDDDEDSEASNERLESASNPDVQNNIEASNENIS